VGIDKHRRRLSKIPTKALAAILAMSICVTEAGMAFADPVLELPQLATTSTPIDTAADETAPVKPRPRETVAMPKELGTLQDYERESDSDPAVGNSQGFASSAPANRRFEANPSGQTLAQNVIIGALMLGVFAMELHAAHQHRHR
jgi:hypothetical protein